MFGHDVRTCVGSLLALASSLSLAVGGWLQWRGVQGADGDPLPIRDLVRAPMWVGGILASSSGTIAYHGALLLAPLTLVQPLSSLHVAFTAMLAWAGRRVRCREWSALLLCLAGTACLALSDVGTDSPRVCWTALAILGLVGGIGLLMPAPDRMRRFWPALRAGLCYGLSAILWKAGMGLPAASAGWTACLALFVAGFLGGFVFLQVAFRRLDAGTANAVAACVAALFPLTAGVTAFGEGASALTIGAAVTAILGVFLLGTAVRPVSAPDSPPTP
jgi:drug/metabolite transporter (DMT)-like permease